MHILIMKWLTALGFKIPAVFTYLSTRMILGAMTSLLFCLLLGPYFITKLYALKIGQPIRIDECPLLAKLHENKKQTPTMGGILILSSMILSLILWMDLSNPFTYLLLLTTLVLGCLGGYDDFLKLKYKNAKGLSGRKKMGVQIALASLISLYLLVPSVAAFFPGKPPMAKEVAFHKESQALTTSQYLGRYYIPFYKEPIVVLTGGGLLITFLVILFIISGTSNAVNLTDGLDGLAAGLLVFSSGVLAIFAFFSNNVEMARYLNILYIEGSGDIAIYLCSTFGACLGFLWFNGYPAQVFMGDTGSLALGGVLGLCSILLRREFLLAIVGGMFVIEALSVILQVASFRLRRGKRIFLIAPLHHHFEYKGWPETKVVLRFWIIGLILAMLGLASLKFQ